MRNEGPPNKEVHAEDLVAALANLHARPGADDALFENSERQPQPTQRSMMRKRAATLGGTATVVYDPQEHGDSPDLPAIAVEDTTMSPLPLTPVEIKFERTARPPVELME